MPTRALVRGIRQGKVPPDTEAREVAGGAWLPLASYDEFYEALGLDDAATRVVETPWFAGRQAHAGAQDLIDADEEEDEEATRVMESLNDSLPGFADPTPLPSRRLPGPPMLEDPKPLARPIAVVDPLAATMAAPQDPNVHSGPGGLAVHDANAALGIAPPASSSPLLDADAEEASAVSRASQAPLPAAGRPAPRSIAPAAVAGIPNRRRVLPIERADERTAPAMRYVQQIDRQRRALLVVVSVAAVLALLVVLLLLIRR